MYKISSARISSFAIGMGLIGLVLTSFVSIPSLRLANQKKQGVVAAKVSQATPTDFVCGKVLLTMTDDLKASYGTLLLQNNKELMYATFQVPLDLKIEEIHLYAGTQEGIPITSKKEADMSQFGNHQSFASNLGVKTVTFTFDVKDLPPTVFIVANAIVSKEGEAKNVKHHVWNEGTRLVNTDLANYYQYGLPICRNPEENRSGGGDN
jgi:hypothetical protein